MKTVKLLGKYLNKLLAKVNLTIKHQGLFSTGLSRETLSSFGLNKGCFFDVGANRGAITDEVIGIFEFFHLFEPNKTLYKNLELKYAQNSNIEVNCLGISDKSGEATFVKTTIQIMSAV